jgi:hypothetical protein
MVWGGNVRSKLKLSRTIAVTAAVLGAGGAIFAPGIGAKAKPATLKVVASHLNNPRGLAFANGKLYVAEAGKGGMDCPTGAKGPTGRQFCFGRTSSLAVISKGKAHPVLSNLISEAETPPPGIAAEGVEAVAPGPSGLLIAYGDSVVGLFSKEIPSGQHLTKADSAAARHELGMLASVAGGQQKVLADVGDADFTWTAVHQNLVPDQFPDANPNALLQVGRTIYVVDAASNTLDSVDRHGRVHQLAFVPNSGSSDAVPTCVARGPDGNLYMGQLAPGAAHNGGKIYRYNVHARKLSVWKTGFNVVDGCGFDKAGNFYAVEFQANGFNPGPGGDPHGVIIKIAPSGARTRLGYGKLFFPQGFATDSRGNIYVSNWSIQTGSGSPSGEVVRINP